MRNSLVKNWAVRQTNSEDYRDLREFFLNLDADTRYMYYGAPTSNEVIDGVWDIFTGQHGNEFFVVEYQDTIIGVCHVSLTNKDAEIGLVTHPWYRNQGVATSLIERAVVWCKTHGVENISLYHIAGNDIACRIVQKHGLTPLMLVEPGEAKFMVPEAQPFEYQQEFFERVASWWATFFKRVRNYIGSKSHPCPVISWRQ